MPLAPQSQSIATCQRATVARLKILVLLSGVPELLELDAPRAVLTDSTH